MISICASFFIRKCTIELAKIKFMVIPLMDAWYTPIVLLIVNIKTIAHTCRHVTANFTKPVWPSSKLSSLLSFRNLLLTIAACLSGAIEKKPNSVVWVRLKEKRKKRPKQQQRNRALASIGNCGFILVHRVIENCRKRERERERETPDGFSWWYDARSGMYFTHCSNHVHMIGGV